MSACVVVVVSLPVHCLCAYKASAAAASADTQESVCCGVRRQMEGLELLLRGVPEEWTQVKRAAREAGEERERLKRKAEALVLAQELAEEQREAAVLCLSVHVYLHKCVYMYAVTRMRHAAMSPQRHAVMSPPSFVPPCPLAGPYKTLKPWHACMALTPSHSRPLRRLMHDLMSHV